MRGFRFTRCLYRLSIPGLGTFSFTFQCECSANFQPDSQSSFFLFDISGGYPHPNGSYGSYPPAGSSSAGGPPPPHPPPHPPSGYHGYGGSGPRPAWSSPSAPGGYMGPPHSNGASAASTPGQGSADSYSRGAYGGYGPRPPYPAGGPPPPHSGAGGQQPYPSSQSYDQYSVSWQ